MAAHEPGCVGAATLDGCDLAVICRRASFRDSNGLIGRLEPPTMEHAEMSQGPNEIIIVDDDPAVRDALAVVFSLEGFHVTSFGDGQSLLAAARARTPSCIILDVHMPGRSG